MKAGLNHARVAEEIGTGSVSFAGTRSLVHSTESSGSDGSGTCCFGSDLWRSKSVKGTVMAENKVKSSIATIEDRAQLMWLGVPDGRNIATIGCAVRSFC